MIDDLEKSEQVDILRFLNEVAPDTYDEGEFGHHTFTAVTRRGNEWNVEFDNDEGSDSVVFSFDHSFLVDNYAWIEAFNAAYNEGDSEDE